MFEKYLDLLKRWTVQSFFPALDKHAKDASQPVVDVLLQIDESKKKLHEKTTSETVQAINSLERTVKGQQNEIINPEAIANPIVEAQNRVVEAVRAIPTVEIPQTDFSSLEVKLDALKEALQGKEMVVNQGDVNVEIDVKGIIKAIETLQKNLPKMEKQEITDYTLLFDQQMTILEAIRDKESEGYKEELDAMLQWLQLISDKKYPEVPFSFSDTGRLKVEIDRTSAGGNNANITNTSGQIINPATEETLQSIAGFSIPKYDEIDATYPSGTQEVYTYKLAGLTVGTITVNYSDSTKNQLTSAIKS